MKKVLFLIHDLGPGGAEKVLVNLVNHMDRSRFDITVMTLFDEGVNKQFLDPAIRYKSCFPKSVPGNSRIMKLFSPEFLYKHLIREEYDILISFLQGPCTRIIAGCHAPRIRKIAWVHNKTETKDKLSIGYRSFSEACECCDRLDTIVFVSEDAKDTFLHLYKPKCSLKVINNIFDADLIRKEADGQTPDHNSCFTWCSMGRLIPVKNFSAAISIQKRLQAAGVPAKLYIIGDGPLRKALIKEIGDANIVLTGFLENPFKLLASCDCLVNTSISEGFSNTIAEAMILGVPVILNRNIGIRELIGDNEYGILTEPDEDAMFEAVYRMAADPELRRHYREAAAERGKIFETGRTVRAVEELLEGSSKQNL